MKSAMDTQQIFYNLTTKFLKPHLAKANSESHLEGLLSGITFTKTLKKKLNQFRSLNLNWNWDCFLLAMKLHTFEIFQPWVRTFVWRKKAWWQSHSVFLRALPRLFTIRKNIYAAYLYAFVLYEGYMRKIYMIWDHRGLHFNVHFILSFEKTLLTLRCYKGTSWKRGSPSCYSNLKIC